MVNQGNNDNINIIVRNNSYGGKHYNFKDSYILYDINYPLIFALHLLDNNIGPEWCEKCYSGGNIKGVFVKCCMSCGIKMIGRNETDHMMSGGWNTTSAKLVGCDNYKNRLIKYNNSSDYRVNKSLHVKFNV
jgi:hypothetical protein